MTTVRREDHPDGVRLLTLDRPPANALDEALLADLGAELDAAGGDDAVRALVLTGAGAAHALRTLYRETHVKLLAFPKPTVARLAGHAVAGGLVLVLACDYRLGREGDYRIGLNEVAIGASFPRVALEIVRLRLVPARASELALGAALYPASQAIRLGIVDELMPPDTFDATVLRRVGRLAAFPRAVYAHAKAGMIADALARVAAETPAEEARGAAVWTSPESRAARAALRAERGTR
jgi:enoyl-CoA hydratase